ncbi:hypothetical protein [Rhizobium terrae]|uniref:hypothetical protein n=1 Tax=Rhizobium terrae TaxID=2171756 RepID=UPI000E3BC7AF|nr:hypothetical protein [Rhizobium terrae]
MHFHIDRDIGHTISGWMILDNPAEVPEFSVVVPGHGGTTLKANVLRTDLRDLGLHVSGLVGFEIDEYMMPGLGGFERLVIQETSSGLIIYRRETEISLLEQKVLVCEVSAIPQIRYRASARAFLLPYLMIDRYSLDTITSILGNNYSNSIFLAGQLNWLRHGELAKEKKFLCIAVLRDPFTELAERLIFVKYVLEKRDMQGREFLMEHFAKIIPMVAETNLDDDRSLLKAFRELKPEHKSAIRSPMTALFGATPDEILQRRNVSFALDNLAQFDVVGLREDYERVRWMANSLAGVDVISDQQQDFFPDVPRLATRLKRIGLVADLLDEDIALHSFAVEALRAVPHAFSTPTQPQKPDQVA